MFFFLTYSQNFCLCSLHLLVFIQFHSFHVLFWCKGTYVMNNHSLTCIWWILFRLAINLQMTELTNWLQKTSSEAEVSNIIWQMALCHLRMIQQTQCHVTWCVTWNGRFFNFVSLSGEKQNLASQTPSTPVFYKELVKRPECS